MRPVDGWHSLSKHVTRKHLLGFCCGRLPHIHTVVCFHLLRTHEWVSLGFTIAFEVLQFQFHPWHCVCRMNHHNTTSTNGTSLVYFVVMVWKLLNKRNFDIAAFSDRCLQTGVFFLTKWEYNFTFVNEGKKDWREKFGGMRRFWNERRRPENVNRVKSQMAFSSVRRKISNNTNIILVELKYLIRWQREWMERWSSQLEQLHLVRGS